jgi:cytochrome c oxidase cbb3-type subunit 2
MTRILIPLSLLLASAIFAAAAADREKRRGPDQADSRSDDRGVLRAIAAAPLATRERQNPYEGQPDAVAAGKKLYRRHCAECHGADARGKGRAVNLRSPGVQRAAPGELVWFLRNGNLAGGMPSWSGLPVERRWQIVAYLKSLR